MYVAAVKIEHEGEESYDNMWQKVSVFHGFVFSLLLNKSLLVCMQSRSIWKYIAKNFFSEFDYFLIVSRSCFIRLDQIQWVIMIRVEMICSTSLKI